MKIDIFSHVAPRKYLDVLTTLSTKKSGNKELLWQIERAEFNKALWDMDVRFTVMDKYGELSQVLTPTGPALELFFSPEEAIQIARIYNDAVAEMVSKYPQRFSAAVALLPLNDIEASLKESQRSIDDLGLKGIMLNTPLFGNDVSISKPLDIPELIPIYEMMSKYDLPIWIHPRRERNMPDYSTEDESKFYIYHCFGWPYDTSAAMARLVFSGIMEKYPQLKVITHHCGAMIPFFIDRIDKLCGYQASFDGSFSQVKKPAKEYFRRFYNDTALYGNVAGLMCSHAFFGADHLLFGTDMPYGTKLGDKCTSDTIEAIEQMSITHLDKKKIFEDNAKNLLGL